MKYGRSLLTTAVLFFGSSLFAGMYNPISLTIDSILNGALDTKGTDFAWKANQIYRYNYSKAMSRGSSNLNLMLAKDIADISGNSSYDQAAKIRLLQSSINSLYRVLEGYKSLDNQSMTPVSIPLTTMPVSPAPTTMMSLSVESILNGALGEPYTSKAKEIYNSGVTMYVNDLNKRINALNQGRDAAQNIKAAIDTVYNFLVNYRKNNQPVVQAPVYAPAPPTALSLQSILNGAIGQDYAMKAQNVYNSGVGYYVDDMVRGINSALNAYYPDQNQRINAIKLSIDRNYNFLMNYRKTNPY